MVVVKVGKGVEFVRDVGLLATFDCSVVGTG